MCVLKCFTCVLIVLVLLQETQFRIKRHFDKKEKDIEKLMNKVPYLNSAFCCSAMFRWCVLVKLTFQVV